MSSAGAIRAGAAYIEMFLDQNAVTRGLTSLQAKLRGWSASLGRMGSGAYGGALPGPLGAIAGFAASPAGMFAGLLAAGKSAATFGTELDILSQKTGLAHEVLGGLDYAAKQSGVSTEQLGVGIRQLAKNTIEATRGSKEQADAFRELGINAGEFARLAPDAQFRMMADRLNAIQNPTMRAAMAMKVFGRSGVDILPLLAEGSAGIAALQQRARDLGLTMGGEEAKRLREFGDRMDDLWMVVKRGVAAIGSALAPEIRKYTVGLSECLIAAQKWIANHQELIVFALQATGAIVAGGLALAAFSKALSLASMSVSALVSLTNPLGLVAIGVGALGLAWANASIQGITFGESVLDLTHKLTGLRNAYSDLNGVLGREAAKNAQSGAVEKSLQSGSVEEVDAHIAALEQQKAQEEARAAALRPRLRSGFGTQGRTVWQAITGQDNPTVAGPLKEAEMEIERLRLQIARFKRDRDAALEAGSLKTPGDLMFRGLLDSAATAGKETGLRFLAGMQAYVKANRGIMDELAQLKASAIPDAQQRDIAMANLKYDRKLSDAERSGVNPAFIEQARQQEIANIKDRYAREAAEKAARDASQTASDRLRTEEEIQADIARLRIESTETGIDKERALLALKHEQERNEAAKLGVDMALLKRKQALEQQMLGIQDGVGNISDSITGTFSGYALGGMGGGTIEEHLAAIRESSKETADHVKRNKNEGGGIAVG